MSQEAAPIIAMGAMPVAMKPNEEEANAAESAKVLTRESTR